MILFSTRLALELVSVPVSIVGEPTLVTPLSSSSYHSDFVQSALVNRWTASVSTVRTSGMKREIADVYVEDLPLHEESGSVS